MPSTATPTTARDTVTATVPKNAVSATLLSTLLPGAGHLYAQDKRTGWVLLGLWAGAIAFGAAGENATSSWPALVLVGGTWWYGVIDAHNAVARHNRRGAPRVSLQPHVWLPPARSAGGARRAGLVVHLAL